MVETFTDTSFNQSMGPPLCHRNRSKSHFRRRLWPIL